MGMKLPKMVALLLVGLALSNIEGQTKSASGTETEIRAWLDQWKKAFTAKDADGVIALYADDVVAYDIVPPLQYVGKAAYRADYEAFFKQYQSDIRADVRDLHIDGSGDFAYAMGLELIGGTMANGQKSEVWLRFTSLFRKVNGKWLDFHDHVSVPADLETGKAALDLKP